MYGALHCGFISFCDDFLYLLSHIKNDSCFMEHKLRLLWQYEISILHKIPY